MALRTDLHSLIAFCGTYVKGSAAGTGYSSLRVRRMNFFLQCSSPLSLGKEPELFFVEYFTVLARYGNIKTLIFTDNMLPHTWLMCKYNLPEDKKSETCIQIPPNYTTKTIPLASHVSIL